MRQAMFFLRAVFPLRAHDLEEGIVRRLAHQGVFSGPCFSFGARARNLSWTRDSKLQIEFARPKGTGFINKGPGLRTILAKLSKVFSLRGILALAKVFHRVLTVSENSASRPWSRR